MPDPLSHARGRACPDPRRRDDAHPGAERHASRPGTSSAFPAGRKAGHSLVIRRWPCCYLMIGERNPNEVCVYPDSTRGGRRPRPGRRRLRHTGCARPLGRRGERIEHSSGLPESASKPELGLQDVVPPACGLALPPLCFITWPTNQPSMGGFQLDLLDLVGIGRDHRIDGSLDRAGIGDLLHAASPTMARGSPPSVQTISNRSRRRSPRMTFSPTGSTIEPRQGQDRVAPASYA